MCCASHRREDAGVQSQVLEKNLIPEGSIAIAQSNVCPLKIFNDFWNL